MRYDVFWRHAATEQLFELAVINAKQARRIMIAVRGFGMGQAGDLKKLTGKEEWRLRVGDWRVSMLLSGGIAYINEVNNRRDAYA
jgi:hypothetical protein